MEDHDSGIDSIIEDQALIKGAKIKAAKTKASLIIKALQINSPPILLKEVKKYIKKTTNYTFFVKKVPLSINFSGQIIITGQNVGIMYNSKHNDRRQRFTVAHEFGHLILEHDFKAKTYKEIIDFKSKSAIEIEANVFAAELLMPKDILRKEITNNTVNGIDGLSKKFWVSKKALWFKITNDKLDKYL